MTEEITDPSALYILAKVREALPIDDLLGWMISEHPDADLKNVQLMLQTIYRGDFTITPAADVTRQYTIGERSIDAYPQRVDA